MVLSVVKNTNDLVLAWPAASGTGSVCAHNGGLQLSVTGLPTYAYLSNFTPMTINKLALTLGASTGALTGPWRSPSTCPKARTWSGSAGFTFSASTVQAPFTVACKAK